MLNLDSVRIKRDVTLCEGSGSVVAHGYIYVVSLQAGIVFDFSRDKYLINWSPRMMRLCLLFMSVMVLGTLRIASAISSSKLPHIKPRLEIETKCCC